MIGGDMLVADRPGHGAVIPDGRPFSLVEATGRCRQVAGLDEDAGVAELCFDGCPGMESQAWWRRGRAQGGKWREGGKGGRREEGKGGKKISNERSSFPEELQSPSISHPNFHQQSYNRSLNRPTTGIRILCR